VRNAGPTEQCCWLGSSRYRGRCGHTITNAYCDTNTNRNTNRYGDAQCYTNSHSYADGHG